VIVEYSSIAKFVNFANAMHSSQRAPIAHCSVCGSSFRTVLSSGLLRKHGWGHGHPPCVGSGMLPGVAVLDHVLHMTALNAPSQIGSENSQLGLDAQSKQFTFEPPGGVLLKRLPRGARMRASAAFESCLRGVLDVGADEFSWKRLLSFPRCFYRPSRGRKRYNLTSRIFAQIEAFENGSQLVAPSSSGGGVRLQNLVSKSKKSKPTV